MKKRSFYAASDMYMRSHNLRTTWRRFITCIAVGLFLGLAITTFVPQPVVSQSTSPLSGYAWSDTIGWISTSASGYGLSMNSSGYITGYAWSDNIGWVKFGGLSSFPSGAGTTAANARVVSGNLTGWARACAGTAPGDCSTMTSRTDGWDGWISLGGTGYGVTFNSSTGAFGSYAWGDVNVGWVDFSNASTQCIPPRPVDEYYCNVDLTQSCHYDAACTEQCIPCPYRCSSLDGKCNGPPSTNCTIEVRPTLIGANNVGATVSWDVSNVKNTCTITGTNGDSWSTVADATDRAASSTTSSVLTGPVTFTVTCTGVDDQTHTCSAEAEFAPSFKEF